MDQLPFWIQETRSLSVLLRLGFKLSFFIKLSVKDVSFDPEPLHP